MQTFSIQPGTNPPHYWPPPRNAVGWGAVEDAVRKDDEQQVNDCKDDINTLLTFAGLYSAALTALLALAFGMLQEDVASESLQVLRQISTQTMTYQILPGGLLNATIVPPPPPPPAAFQPSDQAIRVNVLWFASLVLSLATASIGILVKQWLRAYTTYTTSSAQGRMRTRHFRHEGLKKWQVFEIAAALPYLIQLALGLFFVGLCYFTAEVDPRLGDTTLPLVAAWAFFLLMTSLFPIFSSQCPYKAVSFERTLSRVRRRLFAFLATAASIPPWVREWSKRRTLGSDSEYAEPYSPIDEAHAAKYPGNDTRILTWADTLQSDDELLGTGMVGAFKQSELGATAALNFCLRAISDRTLVKLSPEDDAMVPDCRTLTPQAYTGIVDILSQASADYVAQYMKDSWYDVPWTTQICWTICIMLSAPKQMLPPSGLRLLGRCLCDYPSAYSVTKYVCEHMDHGAALKLMLTAVQHVCREDNVDFMISPYQILYTLKYHFELAGLPQPYYSDSIFRNDRQDQLQEWGNFLNASSLADTVIYLAEDLRRYWQASPSIHTRQDFLDSMYSLIFRLSAIIHTASSASRFSPDLSRVLSNASMDCIKKQDAIAMKSMILAVTAQPHVFLSTYNCSRSFFESGSEVIGLDALQPVMREVVPTEGGMDITRAINLSYVVVDMLPLNPSKIQGAKSWRMWRTIIDDLGRLLEDAIVRGEKKSFSSESIELFQSELDWIDHMATGAFPTLRVTDDDTEYMRWSQSFQPEQSMFDDHFVCVIAGLVPQKQRLSQYWRVRRLQDLKRQERARRKERTVGGGTASKAEYNEYGVLEAIRYVMEEHCWVPSEPEPSAGESGESNESGSGSAVAGAVEVATDKVEAGDGNDDSETTTQLVVPALPLSEQDQIKFHSHSEEGGVDGDTMVVLGKVEDTTEAGSNVNIENDSPEAASVERNDPSNTPPEQPVYVSSFEGGGSLPDVDLTVPRHDLDDGPAVKLNRKLDGKHELEAL